MYFIGIDPGSQGALCLLDPSTKRCKFLKLPNNSNLITPREILGFLDSISIEDLQIVGLEEVHSIFGMSAKSNFQFGKALGMIETICRLSSHGLDTVQPKVWQKGVGIKFPTKSKPAIKKRITAQRVQELYPNADIFGPKGGLLDGRADALMIAHYMSLKYAGGLDATT